MRNMACVEHMRDLMPDTLPCDIGSMAWHTGTWHRAAEGGHNHVSHQRGEHRVVVLTNTVLVLLWLRTRYSCCCSYEHGTRVVVVTNTVLRIKTTVERESDQCRGILSEMSTRKVT